MICGFIADFLSGEFVFTNLHSNQSISAKGYNVITRRNSSFSDFLSLSATIEMILPIIKNMKYPSPTKYKTKQIHKITLDLLFTILTLGNHIQEEFHRINGFQIISYLLKKPKNPSLSYQSYLIFYFIWKQLANTTLRNDLLANILLDLKIWMSVIPSDHLSILKHIQSAIFKDEPQSRKIYPFHNFLNYLADYLQAPEIRQPPICFSTPLMNQRFRKQILQIMMDSLFDFAIVSELRHLNTFLKQQHSREVIEYLYEFFYQKGQFYPTRQLVPLFYSFIHSKTFTTRWFGHKVVEESLDAKGPKSEPLAQTRIKSYVTLFATSPK
jgi:hypothetical protein